MSNILGSLLLLSVMAAFLISPKRYALAFTNGLSVYAISVLPTLFPFMLFTALSIRLNWNKSIGKLLQKPIGKITNYTPYGAYVYFMSIISGYPIGAKLTGELYELKRIDGKTVKNLVSFTSTSGVIFIVGTIGGMIFSNATLGIVVLCAHFLSALITGAIFCNIKKEKVGFCNDIAVFLPNKEQKDILGTLLDNIFAVLVVGSYIALFNLLGEMLISIRLLPFIAKGIAYMGVDYELSFSILYSVVEMTQGAVFLAKTPFSFLVKGTVLAFTISFGGISVMLQSLTFLSKAKIKPQYYLLVKLTEGLIAAVIAFVIGLIVFR